MVCVGAGACDVVVSVLVVADVLEDVDVVVDVVIVQSAKEPRTKWPKASASRLASSMHPLSTFMKPSMLQLNRPRRWLRPMI